MKRKRPVVSTFTYGECFGTYCTEGNGQFSVDVFCGTGIGDASGCPDDCRVDTGINHPILKVEDAVGSEALGQRNTCRIVKGQIAEGGGVGTADLLSCRTVQGNGATGGGSTGAIILPFFTDSQDA